VHPFSYHRATTIDDAVAHLSTPGAVPLGGGTDLVVALKEELLHPTTLVDLSRAADAGAIEWREDGGVRIGAAVRVADLAANARIQRDFLALAEACASVGTPALRGLGTIGGNLCQRPRCWYLRQGISCFKSGGSSCPAAAGENQYHAIFGGGPCFIVHPSDPAVALTALDASVEIRGRGATRSVPIASFYVLPAERLDSETVLEPGEVVSAIEIPSTSVGGRQLYEKVMQRGTWDFALVSLASVRRPDGEVRLVFGGIAPKPWRVTRSVEEDLEAADINDDDIPTLAERALYDAKPLAKNGYKVEIAENLLRRGMAALNQR
jgi:xanthine dehydrogenase YagS FAD-binding subunit